MNQTIATNFAGQLSAEGPGGPAVTLLVIFGIGIAALAALCISAVVSILRSPILNSNRRRMWLLIVVILQFFGPVAWFLFGRRLPADRPNQ